jgi:hypothetical protein
MKVEARFGLVNTEVPLTGSGTPERANKDLELFALSLYALVLPTACATTMHFYPMHARFMDG